MKLPSYPKKGRSLALDFRQLLDWCRANRISGVTGGKLKRSASGTVIEIDRERTSRARQILPPFHVTVFPDATDTLQAKFERGYVREQQQTGADPIAEHEPEIGGVKISVFGGGTNPILPVTPTSKFWVNVTTDERGKVNAPPTIVDAAAPTNTHHVPPHGTGSLASADPGTTGDYYFLIAEFEPSAEDATVPKVKRRITGHIWMPNQLIENISLEDSNERSSASDPAVAQLYRRFNETTGRHEWRALKEGDNTRLTETDTAIEISALGGNPWVVSENGDDTVDVAAGVIGWWVGTVTGGVTGTPYHHAYQKFAATAGITVPAGGGYIVVVYGSTAQDRGEKTTTNGGDVSMHAYGKAVTSGSVKFSADPSAETDDIVIVIAEVSLDGDSKAVVDHQVLTHNPIVEIGELENTA